MSFAPLPVGTISLAFQLNLSLRIPKTMLSGSLSREIPHDQKNVAHQIVLSPAGSSCKVAESLRDIFGNPLTFVSKVITDNAVKGYV